LTELTTINKCLNCDVLLLVFNLPSFLILTKTLCHEFS